MELDCFSQRDFRNRTKRNVSYNELSCCYHCHTIHKSEQSNNNLPLPTPKHRIKDSRNIFISVHSPALKDTWTLTQSIWLFVWNASSRTFGNSFWDKCQTTQCFLHIYFWQLYSAKLVILRLYYTIYLIKRKNVMNYTFPKCIWQLNKENYLIGKAFQVVVYKHQK